MFRAGKKIFPNQNNNNSKWNLPKLFIAVINECYFVKLMCTMGDFRQGTGDLSHLHEVILFTFPPINMFGSELNGSVNILVAIKNVYNPVFVVHILHNQILCLVVS